jgi:hypothetical protein
MHLSRASCRGLRVEGTAHRCTAVQLAPTGRSSSSSACARWSTAARADVPLWQVNPQVPDHLGVVPERCLLAGPHGTDVSRGDRNPPAADQYLLFFPDGTFIDHRVTDQLIVPSRFYERVQRGTYEIQRQTIIFTFSDGHRGTRTFLAPKVQANNPAFDWIDFGWQMLFEEGYRARLSQGS